MGRRAPFPRFAWAKPLLHEQVEELVDDVEDGFCDEVSEGDDAEVCQGQYPHNGRADKNDDI